MVVPRSVWQSGRLDKCMAEVCFCMAEAHDVRRVPTSDSVTVLFGTCKIFGKYRLDLDLSHIWQYIHKQKYIWQYIHIQKYIWQYIHKQKYIWQYIHKQNYIQKNYWWLDKRHETVCIVFTEINVLNCVFDCIFI